MTSSAASALATNSSTVGRSRPSSTEDLLAPSSKRIKCRDDEDIGHPIEDEATAKKKLREAGFNPDRVSQPARLPRYIFGSGALFTPMIYFSYEGDLPMCRYLFLNGAKSDVTKSCSKGIWFPMLAAAHGGEIAICKWLYEHGAAEDVCRDTVLRYPGKEQKLMTPLRYACFFMEDEELCQWLVVNGALHGEQGGEFDEEVAHRDICCNGDSVGLKPWAENAVSCYEAFFAFLLGTLPLPDDSSTALELILSRKLNSQRSARIIVEKTPPKEHVTLLKELSPLHILSGNPGILETVADFVGVAKCRRHRRILRDVANFFEKNPGAEDWHLHISSGDEDDFSIEEEENSDDDQSGIARSNPTADVANRDRTSVASQSHAQSLRSGISNGTTRESIYNRAGEKVPAWFVERVCVQLKRNQASAVIKAINADGDATVELEDKSTVTVGPTEVTWVEPNEHEMVIVTGGDVHVGAEGELLCIDGTDAIVKGPDDTIKLVDWGNLSKIQSSPTADVANRDRTSVASQSHDQSLRSGTSNGTTRESIYNWAGEEVPAWFVERVCVQLKCNQASAVIKAINADGDATVELEDKSTVTVGPTEVTLIVPNEHDMVIVTGGDVHVGAHGELLCIDGTDAIVKGPDDTYKLIDYGNLSKIQSGARHVESASSDNALPDPRWSPMRP